MTNAMAKFVHEFRCKKLGRRYRSKVLQYTRDVSYIHAEHQHNVSVCISKVLLFTFQRTHQKLKQSHYQHCERMKARNSRRRRGQMKATAFSRTNTKKYTELIQNISSDTINDVRCSLFSIWNSMSNSTRKYRSIKITKNIDCFN